VEQELEILKILSTGLQGRINDRVYYIVDGKQRSRAYKEPEDPKTAPQLAQRRVFAALVKRWHALKGDEKNYWNLSAKQSGRKRSTGFNAFMREGMIKYKAAREREESAPAPEIIKPERRRTRRFVRIVRHAVPANRAGGVHREAHYYPHLT
jgi:hypothetical protein